jgi:hypothetical protein
VIGFENVDRSASLGVERSTHRQDPRACHLALLYPPPDQGILPNARDIEYRGESPAREHPAQLLGKFRIGESLGVKQPGSQQVHA